MTNRSTSLVDVRHQLLSDGIESYCEAMTALAHFRHAVFGIGKRVVERRLEQIAHILGVNARGVTIANLADEVDEFYEGPGTFIGAKVRISGKGTLWCGFDWQEREDGLKTLLHVSFEASRKAAYVTIAKAVEERFRDVKTDEDSWLVAIEEPIDGKTEQMEGRLGRMTDSLLKKLAAINIRKLAQIR